LQVVRRSELRRRKGALPLVDREPLDDRDLELTLCRVGVGTPTSSADLVLHAHPEIPRAGLRRGAADLSLRRQREARRDVAVLERELHERDTARTRTSLQLDEIRLSRLALRTNLDDAARLDWTNLVHECQGAGAWYSDDRDPGG